MVLLFGDVSCCSGFGLLLLGGGGGVGVLVVRRAGVVVVVVVVVVGSQQNAPAQRQPPCPLRSPLRFAWKRTKFSACRWWFSRCCCCCCCWWCWCSHSRCSTQNHRRHRCLPATPGRCSPFLAWPGFFRRCDRPGGGGGGSTLFSLRFGGPSGLPRFPRTAIGAPFSPACCCCFAVCSMHTPSRRWYSQWFLVPRRRHSRSRVRRSRRCRPDRFRSVPPWLWTAPPSMVITMAMTMATTAAARSPRCRFRSQRRGMDHQRSTTTSTKRTTTTACRWCRRFRDRYRCHCGDHGRWCLPNCYC
mmetsp:Transcript_15008/g.32153  ORF Transcript_15008/g.32153 Transcript_15008/m.32153 type:complete len:301 (-) Transcript_15008:65-967(-)